METHTRRRKIVTENRVLWFISLFVSIGLALGFASLLAALFQSILDEPLVSFGVFCLVVGVLVFLGCIYLPRAAELAPGSWISLSGDRRLSKREVELERARVELQREQIQSARAEAETTRAREETARSEEAAERERARAEGRASAARQLVRSQRKALLNTIATLEERAGMLVAWQTSGHDLFNRFGHERATWEQDRDVLLQEGTYDLAVRRTDKAFHTLDLVPLHEDVPTPLLAQAQGAIAGAVIELQERLANLPRR
jgi:hypothetical protein